jgi:hypothetical protein
LRAKGLKTKRKFNKVTKEFVIDRTYSPANLPQHLFSKEGKHPFCKGMEGGISYGEATLLWTDE